MKIEKLPSGSYRIRKMYKGQMYTVVFDEKPTQKEALQAMSEKLDSVPSNQPVMNFSESKVMFLVLPQKMAI